MSARASGTFEVNMTPIETDEDPDGSTLGRMSLQKRFHGEMEADGEGEMLTAITPVPESAGYVAIERIRGRVHGRTGSFVLQHNGIMTRGEQELTLRVVPDSGTGELEGIAGSMTITMADGSHAYELEYTLPDLS